MPIVQYIVHSGRLSGARQLHTYLHRYHLDMITTQCAPPLRTPCSRPATVGVLANLLPTYELTCQDIVNRLWPALHGRIGIPRFWRLAGTLLVFQLIPFTSLRTSRTSLQLASDRRPGMLRPVLRAQHHISIVWTAFRPDRLPKHIPNHSVRSRSPFMTSRRQLH